MIKKVLIANRGEIALRVVRACRELGITTVAVHSEADTDSLHVKFADESVCIGPAASQKSYLNILAILSAAEITNADAIHPGYGFLAENAEFVEVCGRCNIVFIGPTAKNISELGNKILAKKIVREAGVKVLGGSDGFVNDPNVAIDIARAIGYPIILKAAFGGGGRGMKIVRSDGELTNALLTSEQEAVKSFGDGSIYVEKYVENPRHVEIQILADHHGNIVHLGERDCSVQRRHQKLIEESPSPAVNPELRKKMGDAAIKVARSSGYRNAGTVEFLLDPDGNFYFLEMNTRIQVEHPVSEFVTGIDLVKQQIRIAEDNPLPFSQDEIRFDGHAIECRINAEDPYKFTPSPGLITEYHPPGGNGVRLDSAAYSNYFVSPNYDSLIGKLIVHAEDRHAAIRKMSVALREFVIEGIRTSIPFYQEIFADEEFISGKATTAYIPQFLSRR